MASISLMSIFGAVERGFAFHLFVRNFQAVHWCWPARRESGPSLRVCRRNFPDACVPIGEFHFEIIETEIFHHGVGEIDASLDFGFDLRRPAKMCASS